jgi:hypothetical protein
MKLIEGMKLVKELQVKADDLRKKIALNCALLSIETPMYPDPKRQVREWLQVHEDITREIARLRVRVAKTNLATVVSIKVGAILLEKCITEWIARRKELAPLDMQAWAALGDRGLKEQNLKTSADGPITEVRIMRFFDPVERDNRIATYRDEPGLIDRTLEVINAVTDLLD